MPDIHTIRLKHPWQCEPCAAGARWLRSFNWPAGLTPREAVRLVIDGLPEGAAVWLSGKPLAGDADGRFDVTRLIADFNELAIEVGDSPPAGETECPWDVWLEIVEG